MPRASSFLVINGFQISGHNPCDIAASYGDARVYDIVKAKWDSLPPLNDKKKGGKGGNKTGKRPASGPANNEGGRVSINTNVTLKV